jgi:Ca2+-binding EF-hand superfamily protein
MQFKSNLIIHPITTGVIAAFFVAGLSTTALADNKAALKDSIGKIAEVKTSETKALDSTTKSSVEADFKKLDVNSNYKISFKEAVIDKDLSANFDTIDKNKDGNISPEEYSSYKASKSLGAALPSESSATEAISATTAAPAN